MRTDTNRGKDTGNQPEPIDRLIDEATGLAGLLAQRATKRLTDFSEHGGSGVLSAVTGKALGGGSKGGLLGSALSGTARKLGSALGVGGTGGGKRGGRSKVTNIVESVEVGVPIRVAYDQWTQFADYPSFMKTIEDVDAVAAEKLEWTAKIGWSRRNWTAEILEQVPEERIVWRSSGAKGSVDGAVTFHELAPSLTHIELVLEYFPKGVLERGANLMRVQGRRARRELRHFQRHVTAHSILHTDELDGWRGEIHDGEVTNRGDDSGRGRRTGTRARGTTKSSGTRKPAASTGRRTTTRPRRRKKEDDS